MKANIAAKILIKKILLVVLALIGYVVLVPFLPGRRKNRLVILRYHSVGDFRGHEVNVRTSAFKKQMKFIAEQYEIISLQKAVEYLKKGKGLPKKAVAVTFDDGYKDNYTNMYPILKELRMSATIFLTAGYIGTEKILPHDAGDDPAYNHLLSWNEVREMAQSGIDFGSHTESHVNLGGETADLKREISESKKLIERELQKEVWAISYPFGLIRDFSENVKRMARDAGYTAGFSAMNGVNDSKTDIFGLKRIGIEASDNMFTFRAKLNGALDLLAIKDTLIMNKLLSIFNRLLGV